jgi:putative transcriptional regulator
VSADDQLPARSPWVGLDPAPGRLLVAAPALVEATFANTVLYVLEHDEGGTAAVILNRPSRMPVGQVLPDWHDAVSGPSVVFTGGPVQPDGALCLGLLSDVGREQLARTREEAGPHDRDRPQLTVRPVVDSVCSVDLDGAIDPVIAATTGLRIFAGHAGWSPGQLDDELAEGAWFVVAGTALDVFAGNPGQLRRDVLRRSPTPLNLFATYPPDPSLN